MMTKSNRDDKHGGRDVPNTEGSTFKVEKF